MAHQRALLLLLAISCGNYNVQSFSFVPGASPSRGWSGASCIFARNAPVFARNVGDGAGRDSAGHVACLSATRAAVSAESGEYLESKEALKKDLRQEYESFFDNFESERYLPNVQFIDPVTSFTGFQNYKKNLDMLGGRSVLGSILFKDASIVLHEIEEPGPFRLRTRWTLTVCFKALPWRPVPRFTGISEYTLDDEARVVKQEDYWDSINLVEGRYQSVSPLEGVKDFVGQVLPGPQEKIGQGGAVGELLRRAKGYEVRRVEGGCVVAMREFDDRPAHTVVVSNSRALLEGLLLDGLKATGTPELVTPGPRKKHQVRVNLAEHDWMT